MGEMWATSAQLKGGCVNDWRWHWLLQSSDIVGCSVHSARIIHKFSCCEAAFQMTLPLVHFHMYHLSRKMLYVQT
jgi:hypothetical protein